MKNIRKWLVRIGIALLVIVIILTGVGAWFVRRPWPQTSGTIKVPGLLGPVEVIRDQWGIPHIYAQNEHDLLFTQGYVHAQDRLWQMEVSRRTANGTLSEAMGRPAVAVDEWTRTFGARRMAEQSWEELGDDSRTVLEDYAAGVNAYIDTHRNRLPLEFTILSTVPEPWTPVDIMAIGNLLVLMHSSNSGLESLMAKITTEFDEKIAHQLLLPPPIEDAPVIVPAEAGMYDQIGTAHQLPPRAPEDTPIMVPAEASMYDRVKEASFGSGEADDWLGDPYLRGTNTWAVHGNHTTTGKPILANDLHQDLSMPSLWYENGLHGGRFDSVGFTLPGVPLIIIGHNQYTAWGFTSLHADIQDNYIEKLDNPDNPTRYEFMGAWYDLDVIHETIEVKGSEPVELDVFFTRHGVIAPLLYTFDQAPVVALRWTLHEGNETLTSIVKLNLAKGWDEFRTALQYWDMPVMSFVYADVEGNIGFQAAGKVPIRVPAHYGGMPVPGWTGEREWQGFIPFDALPTVLNPQQDFVVAANNKVVSDDYPYSLAFDYFPGFRARRIIDLLAAGDSVTIQDTQDIQTQTYSVFAGKLRPYLLAIEPENDFQAEALAQVEAWDLYYEMDSIGASIYEVWYRFLLENTLEDELGEDLVEGLVLRNNSIRSIPFLIGLMPDADNPWFDDVNTPEVESRDDIVRRSLADAVDWLSERYGDDLDGWKWGRLHTVTFVHTPLGQSGIAPLEKLFNSNEIGIPGSRYTVNGSFYWWTDPFNVVLGPTQRMILDLSNWDNSLAVNSTGQSEHLFHPHREDQISLWQNREYRPMLFTREAVEENAESVLMLTPQ